MALLVEALRNPEYNGVYNGTAPNPVRMSELCSSLGAALQHPPPILALVQLRHTFGASAAAAGRIICL